MVVKKKICLHEKEPKYFFLKFFEGVRIVCLPQREKKTRTQNSIVLPS